MFRGRFLQVEVDADNARYTLQDGHSLEISHHGQKATVEPDATLELAIPRLHPRPTPSQPPGRAPAKRRPPPR
jgi:alpha,alpha-trehalose phosphorylase